MKKVLEFPIRLLVIIAGTISIFAIPYLFRLGDTLTFTLEPLGSFIKLRLMEMAGITKPNSLSLFEELNAAEAYRYSMTILGISLLVAIVIGIFGAIIIQMSPRTIRNGLKKVIDFIGVVPDLFIIFLFQFVIITLYKETGLKFLQLYGMFGNKPLFVPIVTTSFLPALMLMQFLIKELAQEESKDYVQYTVAKGLKPFRILLVHMVRNIFPLVVIQLRTIIWVLLSNLYLLEFMFNLPGFTKTFMITYGQGDFLVFVICLLLFTLPLLIIEAVSFIVLKFYNGKEAASL
ncbi:ABC transporter permease subunit [Neobacillus dielmonensis]|uniref:ABC transporter permease subunit n=1 Tax=Neobacillus dielmonensis TaxID=1347369 RepID=UPI0005AABB98|nr:ABC transporter permease subunit [Neobacillus dielmonensis]